MADGLSFRESYGMRYTNTLQKIVKLMGAPSAAERCNHAIGGSVRSGRPRYRCRQVFCRGVASDGSRVALAHGEEERAQPQRRRIATPEDGRVVWSFVDF